MDDSARIQDDNTICKKIIATIFNIWNYKSILSDVRKSKWFILDLKIIFLILFVSSWIRIATSTLFLSRVNPDIFESDDVAKKKKVKKKPGIISN